MTKNEIVVARWILGDNDKFDMMKSIQFESDYNHIHKAWAKFRDLKFATTAKQSIYHNDLCDRLSWTMTHGTITEAFDELVKGIEWYESLKNKL